ncbi:serine protease eatA domain protein [Escherichia coli 6-319-05_S4_C3]|nr:serine protease eatA domain protein [Escherichia coli 6-319-05_S4_C3]
MVITGLSQLKIFFISNQNMILIKQYHMTLKRVAYNGDIIKIQEWEH